MKRLLFICLFFSAVLFAQERMKYGIVIHGGAGNISRNSFSEAEENLYRDKLKEALDAGYRILNAGGSSMDAVTAAVVVLEDSPLFNAGKGAVLNNEGRAELDVSVMDGSSMNAGAAAGLHHIKNPVLLARKIMEFSPHVLMIGEGAEKFARQYDIEFRDADYFITPERLDQLKRQQKKEKVDSSEHGTVGAVALDKMGNLAAATSTGGMSNKRFGRVGDSPIIGAGTYANNKSCAVSCTGHGEFFIKHAAAFDVSARMLYKGSSLEDAAGEVIYGVLKNVNADGGLIAIDKDGYFTMPFNTEGMFRGWMDQDGKYEVRMFKD